jgi:uncharacterized Ntn-hydrolase superfamily protein
VIARRLPYLSTFSVTARCPRTGELGIAVSTCEPSVGWIVPFVRAGVGAIASQARSNPYFGIDGLRLLAAGQSASQALATMLTADAPEDRDQRQLAIVDRDGETAAYTGERCRPWAGHRVGEGVVVAGNLLVGAETVDAMLARFAALPEETLSERLVAALEAGQAAGGDRRGRISAALLVAKEGEWPWIDVRVDSHTDPVPELRRIFEEFKTCHLDPSRVEMITPPVVYPLAELSTREGGDPSRRQESVARRTG